MVELAPRDGNGRFIKKGTDPADAVRTQTSISSPPPPPESPLDEPLVSFSVQNPFKKILHWLDDLRRHQTTTFDFKIKIPLIALPIFLVVLAGAFQYFFSLGKQSAQNVLPTPTAMPTVKPSPILISKVGVIKATYQVLAETDEASTPSPIITLSEVEGPPPTLTSTPTPTPIPPSRYVLVDKDDKIFFLITPSNLSLQRYLNQRVLVTGMYDAQKETIEINQSSDIEILP